MIYRKQALASLPGFLAEQKAKEEEAQANEAIAALLIDFRKLMGEKVERRAVKLVLEWVISIALIAWVSMASGIAIRALAFWLVGQ